MTVTEADLIQQAKTMPEAWQGLGYHELNAMLDQVGLGDGHGCSPSRHSRTAVTSSGVPISSNL